MPNLGKEAEQRPNFEQVAQTEVDSYIERVEKQVESTQNQQSQNNTVMPVAPKKPVADMGRTVAAQFAVSNNPNIVLPLDQAEVETGLHRKVGEGVKWLAEWCVMMIKKYPGRVFYSPPQQNA